jgi:hypothetical protein
MTASRRAAACVAACALTAHSTGRAHGEGPTRVAGVNEDARLDWRRGWVQPHDAQAAANRSDEFAWRVFVAVNWPAAAGARSANPQVPLGADLPTVWETWANASGVFREDGADPGPWQAQAPAPRPSDSTRFDTSSLKDLPNLRHIVDGKMVPLGDPVSSARRLTEIRINRPEFEYIREHELYNLEGQLQVLAAQRMVNFPATSTEVKAKWRPIEASEKSRYHTVEVRLGDGRTRLFGLTALHVVTKDLPNWFWATFEQVDNPGLADSDGWQLPSRDRFACGVERPDCNRAPSGIGLEGTAWDNYRLRGTLTRFVGADGQALRLANSELEAGIQQTASCITCHARASIGRIGDTAMRLPIFDGAAEAVSDAVGHSGYVGLPQASWFEGVAGAQARPRFRPLDFVWSLSKAKPKGGS